MTDDTTVQRVKDAADIVDVIGEHVSLTRSGVHHKGLCPFHSEKTPSFFVNQAKQLFYCYGCSEGGDVIAFLMKYQNMSFPEALRELADRYGVSLPTTRFSPADKAKGDMRRKLEEITRQASLAYHEFLLKSPKAVEARAYLSKRGISEEIVRRFQLGYAPEGWHFISQRLAGSYSQKLLLEAGLLVKRERGGFYDRFRKRLMCPIYDVRGNVTGFGGRILGDGEPKYLNTDATMLFDKSKTLFGLFQNKEAIRKEKAALVVEGNFDLLALCVHGHDNVVAPLGTSLTQKHIRVLKGYAQTAFLFFDGDTAGRKAAMRSMPLFLSEMMEARVVALPPSHDPDSFVRKFGSKGVSDLLAKALPLTDFSFNYLAESYGLSVEGKARIGDELRRLLASFEKESVAKTLLLNHFSEKLGISPDALLLGERRPKPKAAPVTPEKIAIKYRQLIEFLLCYPQYVAAFKEAGIEELFAGKPGEGIIMALLQLFEERPDAAPEQLLDRMSGQDKIFITSIITGVNRYPEDIATKMADDMVVWLKGKTHHRRKERLMKKILAAQQHKDMDTLIRLMEEKKILDKS